MRLCWLYHMLDLEAFFSFFVGNTSLPGASWLGMAIRGTVSERRPARAALRRGGFPFLSSSDVTVQITE